MRKGWICLILAAIMSLSVGILSFAQGISANGNATLVTEAQILKEIETETATIMEDIYKQLEKQGMLKHLSTYEEAVSAEVTTAIYAKYRAVPDAELNANTTYSLPNGGILGYTSTFYTKVTKTYMTYNQTLPYITNKTLRFICSEIIDKYFDFDPADFLAGSALIWYNIYQAVGDIQTIIEWAQWANVSANGGYAIVMNVVDASGTEESSAVMVWSNHPSCVVPSGSTNVVVGRG